MLVFTSYDKDGIVNYFFVFQKKFLKKIILDLYPQIGEKEVQRISTQLNREKQYFNNYYKFSIDENS